MLIWILLRAPSLPTLPPSSYKIDSLCGEVLDTDMNERLGAVLGNAPLSSPGLKTWFLGQAFWAAMASSFLRRGSFPGCSQPFMQVGPWPATPALGWYHCLTLPS